MPSTVAELMQRSLMDVFNERDADRRVAAAAEVYAADVVWHEPDNVVQGRDALTARAAELQAGFGDFAFSPGGPVSVNDDLGHLPFQLGPPGAPPVVHGMDIAKCRDGVIVELYTFLNG